MKRTIAYLAVAGLGCLLVAPVQAINFSGTITGGGSAIFRDTSQVFDPNNTTVTMTGSVDLSGLDSNGAVLVGLIDKNYYDSGHTGFFGGAYAYFGKTTTGYRVGPSDGMYPMGELVQTFGNTTDSTLDFTVIFDHGTISVSFNSDTGASGPFTQNYGGIEALGVQDAYPGGEFDGGAYFGIDMYKGIASYDVTAGPSSSVPDSGATFLLLSMSAFGILVLQRRLQRA